jgi:Endosomal/lysosomal potassium channel TMEM175
VPDDWEVPVARTREEAVSFILAGMYWVGHRDLFALIRRTDRGLVWLNILYLLPLCLLPFGASLIGRYDQEPVALRVYGLVLILIAAMRVIIWLYATCCGSGSTPASAAPGWPSTCSRGWSTCSPSCWPGPLPG